MFQQKQIELPAPSAKPVLIIVASLILIWLLASTGLVSTWQQVRRYCEMPDHVGTVPQHVQSAILARVPLHSHRNDVQAFLDRRGIGTDGNSICSPVDGGRSIACEIPAHHHFWEIVREQYAITFDFDSDQRLRNVGVHSNLTFL